MFLLNDHVTTRLTCIMILFFSFSTCLPPPWHWLHSNAEFAAPTVKECTSRLKLATKYDFLSIRNRTILHLLTRWPTDSIYNYADFITLGRDYRSGELLIQGYLRALRVYPPKMPTGGRLASEDLVWLMQMGPTYKELGYAKGSIYALKCLDDNMKFIMPNAQCTLPPNFDKLWRADFWYILFVKQSNFIFNTVIL